MKITVEAIVAAIISPPAVLVSAGLDATLDVFGLQARWDALMDAVLRCFVYCAVMETGLLLTKLRFAQVLSSAVQLFVAGVKLVKRCWLAVALLTLLVSAQAVSRAEGSDLFLTSISEHHVAELNSNMPYVAGFNVIADNLTLYGTVQATAVTVSFPSTEPELLPSGCWLGGGMFVQGQDDRFNYVDYGFYMMLVLDASGGMFVDLGLHQTEEATVPIQSAMSNLVYAYTWQITGIDRSTPVTLLQSWDNNGSVDYSMSVSGQNENLITVNVVSMLNCQNIIRGFYTGNVVVDPFPLSRYINYFQFGVISKQAMTDTHWHVDMKEPRILSQTGWTPVNKAWSLEGDHSYLDYNLMWGGADYSGADAQYYQHSLQDPYEIIFFWDGHTLASGTVLWNVPSTNNTAATPFGSENQGLTVFAQRLLPVITFLLGLAIFLPRASSRALSLPYNTLFTKN